jgi:hypothetical protein
MSARTINAIEPLCLIGHFTLQQITPLQFQLFIGGR